jgi:DNA (cytosine-5)-methyltransferase 1
MNELALFAGAGGGILGGKLLGWRTVCAVEWEQYPTCVLLARQNDGLLESFPIWDDVQTFDGTTWTGLVDVISGGFPCQDISAAGKGAGIDGERSGMWREMARIICEVRPKFVFVENSPMLTNRGLGTVLADLAKMGFDAEWGVLGASDIGAKHHRQRIWIVARQQKVLSYSDHRIKRWQQQQESNAKTGRNMANTDNSNGGGQCRRVGGTQKCHQKWNLHTIFNQPEPLRMVDGVAARVDRLKAIGNGQVPQVAAIAWELLTERLNARI